MSLTTVNTVNFDNPIIDSINKYHEQIESASRRHGYTNCSQPRPSPAQENSVHTAIDKIVELSNKYLESTSISTEKDPSELKKIRNEVNVIQQAVYLIKSLDSCYYDISPLKYKPCPEENLECAIKKYTPSLEENLNCAVKKLCLIEADQIRNKANATDEEQKWAYQVYTMYQGGSKSS